METPDGFAKKIDRAWRIFGTGFSFALFGILGLLLSLVVLPAARLRTGTAREGELRSQRIVHRTFRFFVRVMATLGVLRIEVRGAEALKTAGQLVVANHPTLLDVVFLVSLMPQADCVVKRSSWSNPFMMGVVRSAGYLRNDPGDSLISECTGRLRAGRSLLIFPEGTRSEANGLGSFQRGAAHIALESGRPLRPVVIRCDPPSLMRGQKWHDVPKRRMQFTVECFAPIDPSALLAGDEPRGSAARKLSATLRDFYVEKLQTPGR